jgi:hypothetical protein
LTNPISKHNTYDDTPDKTTKHSLLFPHTGKGLYSEPHNRVIFLHTLHMHGFRQESVAAKIYNENIHNAQSVSADRAGF